jgi:hypothetical protein
MMLNKPLSAQEVLEIEKLLVAKKLPQDLHEQVMLLVASHRWIEQKLKEKDAIMDARTQQLEGLVNNWKI